jgi:kynureninase
MEGLPRDREEAVRADAEDPLAPYRSLFHFVPGAPIYLDGNSLGRQPRQTAAALEALLGQWRDQLVGGWNHWMELPTVVGDRVGQLLGAVAGQVVVSDSTTVNLYKLASAAVDARPGRDVIVGDANDFPTVRYVLQGLAARTGYRLRLLATDPVEGPGAEEITREVADDVALVCLSAVNYRSGAILDLRAVTEAAHRVGALVLFDLSHAAGAVPVNLDGSGVDLAVGCGYKYLNGGPGAPAWLFVRTDLQARLRQPIWGWFGQEDQFGMGPVYKPVDGIGRFLTGTPDVAGITAVSTGIEPLLAAGLPALWAKTRRLVGLLSSRSEELLVPLGARVASPVDPGRRGGHLAISHPDAWSAAYLLVQHGLVVPDFRPPDVLRLAPVAIYTSFTDVWDAVDRIAAVLADPAVHERVPRKRVT